MPHRTMGDPAAPWGYPQNQPSLWLERFPWPAANTHKHSRGRLVIAGAGPDRTGATRLAARAGLRIGAGVVRMLCPPDAAPVYAAALEAVILKPYADDLEFHELTRVADAVLIGPNLGVTPQTRRHVEIAATSDAALVIDADAISVFERDREGLKALTKPAYVLTPHDAEMERILPGLREASRDRASAAREAATRTGAVVVLKGANTCIAAPDGRAAVNVGGSPWLATSGSGDVLAGFIGGLIAQKMDSFDAACAGVWIHSQAAQAFGPGLTAEDLPEAAIEVLGELWERSRA